MEFDIPRQKAAARMSMGTGLPDEFVSALCAQDASLSKNERQLITASAGSPLAFSQVAAQMRRLFGNVGSDQRQDALAAQDLDTVSEEEDFEAWVAYRKAKRATR